MGKSDEDLATLGFPAVCPGNFVQNGDDVNRQAAGRLRSAGFPIEKLNLHLPVESTMTRSSVRPQSAGHDGVWPTVKTSFPIRSH